MRELRAHVALESAPGSHGEDTSCFERRVVSSFRHLLERSDPAAHKSTTVLCHAHRLEPSSEHDALAVSWLIKAEILEGSVGEAKERRGAVSSRRKRPNSPLELDEPEWLEKREELELCFGSAPVGSARGIRSGSARGIRSGSALGIRFGSARGIRWRSGGRRFGEEAGEANHTAPTSYGTDAHTRSDGCDVVKFWGLPDSIF